MKRLLFILLLFTNSHLFSQIFVNQYSVGNNDGTSWEDAYTSLHVALAEANAGDEIWVAKGFYTPSTLDRSMAYEITKPVKIYGGFDDQNSKEEKGDGRTYISGSIGNAADTLDNSFHIFKIADFEGTVIIDGIEFNDAYADGPSEDDKIGGAIFCQSTNLQLNNCWFKRNRAENSSAAIFYNPSVAGELSITNSYFEGNFSKEAEGIYLKTKNSILNIDKTAFGNHTKGTSVIKIDSGNAMISYTDFFNNKNKYNGCIYIEGNSENSVNIKGCKYFNNKGFTSNFLYSYLANVNIDSSHFYNNEIRGSGNIDVYGDTLSIMNSDFDNNTSRFSCGPYATTDVCIIDNVKFLNNNSEMGYGCGYLNCKDVSISNSLIENISSESSIAGFSISSGKFILKKTTFKDLSASSNASMQIDVEGTVLIDSCYFIENKVTGQAGSFYAYISDSLIIKNTQFKSNESTTGESGCYYVNAQEHLLENCSFENNYAKNSAATFTTSGNLRIKNCLFNQNETAFNAGAFSSWGDYAEIVNSVFEDNIASENAGAIYISNDSVVVDRCVFRNNTSREGGALYSSGKTLIIRSVFFNNGSEDCLRGGAVSLNLYKENSYLYGNVFKGNVSENGGAIYLFSGGGGNYKSYLINNTIVDNKGVKGHSGALHFQSGAGLLKNNIIWNNGDSSIYVENEAQIDYNQNIINGIEANSNNLEGEPFLSSSYVPLAFSNAVDFGMEDDFNSIFPEDLYGNQRIQGNGVDIGAVETEYTSELFTLKGKVVYDPEITCQEYEEVIGLKGILILAMPGNYYTTTNAEGEFSFRLPIGNYSVIQNLTEEQVEVMLPLCPKAGIKTDLEGGAVNQIVDAGLFFNQVKTCERLDVQISSLRKRNCFTSETEVLITNKSALPINNKTLKIKLSDNVTVNNFFPDYQNVSIEDDTLNFQISELNSQQTYKLQISDSVNCDPTAANLGDNVCIKALISSQDECTQVSPDWDLSNVEVVGECQEYGAVFYLSNTSVSAMTSEQEYRVFLDDTLVFKGKYQLQGKDSLKISLFDNTFETLRFEADQTEGNPYSPLLYLDFGSCNFMPFIMNNNKIYGKAEKCTQITGSYDPNAIVVSPKGWGDEGNILKDQLLTYTIHFQNTGTDTALKVMIIDTLSQSFDMSTFEELPSSHNAELHLFDNNPTVAVWTLKNINLPASTTDLVGSQGYVSFSVNLKNTVAEGEKIENTADIYFDYNNPITTNTTLNTIRSEYPERLGEVSVVEEIVTSLEKDLDYFITVSPNPFTSSINIKGLDTYKDVEFRLINATGKVVYQGNAAEINNINLDQTGVFIYEIYNRNEVLKRGKLVKL